MRAGSDKWLAGGSMGTGTVTVTGKGVWAASISQDSGAAGSGTSASPVTRGVHECCGECAVAPTATATSACTASNVAGAAKRGHTFTAPSVRRTVLQYAARRDGLCVVGHTRLLGRSTQMRATCDVEDRCDSSVFRRSDTGYS